MLMDLNRNILTLELHDSIKETEFQRSFTSVLTKSGHWEWDNTTQGQTISKYNYFTVN